MANTYYNQDGIAIQGYDVVSLFDGQVSKGSAAFSCDWSGVSWWFVNQENLEKFKVKPESYAPQFGGFCAYGVANGYKADTRIDTFTVYNDKLYLNYTKYVKAFWVDHKDRLIDRAEKHWETIEQDEPIQTNRLGIYLKYLWFKLIGKDFFKEARE